MSGRETSPLVGLAGSECLRTLTDNLLRTVVVFLLITQLETEAEVQATAALVNVSYAAPWIVLSVLAGVLAPLAVVAAEDRQESVKPLLDEWLKKQAEVKTWTRSWVSSRSPRGTASTTRPPTYPAGASSTFTASSICPATGSFARATISHRGSSCAALKPDLARAAC